MLITNYVIKYTTLKVEDKTKNEANKENCSLLFILVTCFNTRLTLNSVILTDKKCNHVYFIS